MRTKTLRDIMCLCMTLVILASAVWSPLPAEAAKTATIPITVGGETFNVTPGQWVTVKTPGGTTSYNVRFVNGKPVALEMSQYQQIIFGDAGSASTPQTGSTGTTSGSTSQTSKPSSGSSQTSGSTAQTGNTGSTSTGATSGSTAQTSKPSSGSSQTSGSTAQTGNAGSTSSTAAQTTTPSNSGNTMSWNDFQKANAGKGMSSSEMSQAYQNYKAGNNGATTGSTGAAQTSGSSAQTSGSAAQTTPQTSVAEGATTSTGAAQTSGSTAQSTQTAQTGATGTGGTVADSSTSAQSSQATQGKTSNWDPAKHPRDPQTGKFISHEEAIARGLMDPADATTTNSSSSQSTQTAQSGEATQATGATSGENVQASSAESTASAQTAQTPAEGATASEGKTKTSIGDKFKSGYETGKNLTNQGFQNVKDSLKSGFSAKNILVTAGITVGVDLATQVMRGENPSLKTALKTVCCAEFAGSVVGSTLGAAAGSFFTPFLSCIPVVGGVLSALAPTFGSIVGSSAGAYLAGDLKNGRFSIKEAFKRIDWVGVTGQTIGSTAGAALGSFLGPVGTVIGGMVGGYLGNWAAHKIAGLFGKGEANLPTIAMPTGKVGGTSVSPTGAISLGGNSSEVSVTVSDEMPTSNVEETTSAEETTSVEASDIDDTQITAAYEEYTVYYDQYSKLIQEGKTAEALEVAKKMNEAKSKYDSLRYK